MGYIMMYWEKARRVAPDTISTIHSIAGSRRTRDTVTWDTSQRETLEAKFNYPCIVPVFLRDLGSRHLPDMDQRNVWMRTRLVDPSSISELFHLSRGPLPHLSLASGGKSRAQNDHSHTHSHPLACAQSLFINKSDRSSETLNLHRS